MDEQHVKGAADKAVGKVKEVVGHAFGDAEMEADGKVDQAKGSAREAAGDAKDAVRHTADSIRNAGNKP